MGKCQTTTESRLPLFGDLKGESKFDLNPPVAEHLSSKCITVQQIICIVLFSKNLSKKGTSCYHKKLKTHKNVVFNFPTSLLYISPKIHGSQTHDMKIQAKFRNLSP